MSWLLPALIAGLILYALIKRVDAYAAFLERAAEALPLLAKLLPCICAMTAALTVFRESGAMDALLTLLSPALSLVGMPAGLAPMFILRPFSGSGAVALLQDVYASFGVDSFEGFAASVMLGSTETIFYTLSLYFGSIGVKKSRHAVPAALAAALVGAAAALVFARTAGV